MKRVSNEERFWSKVDRGDGQGCWLWTGVKSKWGYGQFSFDRRMVQAHRFAYQCSTGVVPEGLCVLHRCDTPACVRPDHLFVGTNAENVADKVAKGRQSSMKGTRHPLAKLTDEQVRAIRVRHARGHRQVDIATDFGIAQTSVSSIVRGTTWAHVEAQKEET